MKQIKSNHILAITVGIVYVWFGVLKFFPHLSPAEGLAKNTIDIITMGLIPSNISIILLAIWETLVGLLLIMNIYRKKVIILAFVHIILTFVPLFIFTKDAFAIPPFSFTLLGQYIFKNIIIIGALVTLYKLPERKALVRFN
ncbi:doxx family protein [Flavisericum labens]|uniref:doxx family protein n=1 Tax=Flavisericum labens TaxID=3377112 RepID=UPI00387B6690